MRKIFNILFLICAVGCKSNEVIKIQKIDSSLSLIRKDNVIYFRSRGSGDCPYDYNYSNSALELGNEDALQQRETHSLTNLVDLAPIKFNYSIKNLYYFEDDKFKYLVSIHLCDNTVIYEEKNTNTR